MSSWFLLDKMSEKHTQNNMKQAPPKKKNENKIL